MMNKLERIRQKKEAVENIRKSPMMMNVVRDWLTAEYTDTRDSYETTAPASEFLRGQTIALKSLLQQLGDK